MKVCAEVDCPTLTRTTRCPAHTRAKDAARGTSTERGYGYAHQQTRTDWAPLVAAGRVACRRCDRPLSSTEPWDLGHPDADCPKPIAPECRPCNRATSGRSISSVR